jgi:hypothetical protein
MLNYVMKMDPFFNVIKLKVVYMLGVEYMKILSCMSDYRWGLDWRLDLLTTLTHNS